MQAFIGHLAFVERKAEAVAGIEAADDFIKSFGNYSALETFAVMPPVCLLRYDDK